MVTRFDKRDRTGLSSSNTWKKEDIGHIGDANETDFTQRSNSSIQSIDKLSQDSGNKANPTAKMSAQQSQRGVNQYYQVQSNNLDGHQSQNQLHHLDKKSDDVFKNASSGNDSQQRVNYHFHFQSCIRIIIVFSQ